ncbi:hypothetical protein GCM10027051_06280 [Niabella terrae]
MPAFYRHMLLQTVLFLMGLGSLLDAAAQEHPLNKDIRFAQGRLFYKHQEIVLGPAAFYIDAGLSDQQLHSSPYVFRSLQVAARQLQDGSEAAPMRLYIAPYVYWLDDPDDPAERRPAAGTSLPFAMEIQCQWLQLYGLADSAQDVVLAANRGQTIGARGNYTLLHIEGDGFYAENISFGNYCNVDLVYPLKPALNRKKRADAIVQAQIGFCKGDRIFFRNCRFISRLNTCPFIGGKRTLYEGCYFECTDDALNGNAVYLNCRFDFYSSKPFWGSSGIGAVFLNCDIHTHCKGRQFFVKSGGPITLIDSRINGTDPLYIGWRDRVDLRTRNYIYGLSWNGQPLSPEPAHPETTVDLRGLPLLDAYRFVVRGKTYYNTYSLLKGPDDWDPLELKAILRQAGKKADKALQLWLTPSEGTIETGKDSVEIQARALGSVGNPLPPEGLNWQLGGAAHAARLIVRNDSSCLLIPANHTDSTCRVQVLARTRSGLEAVSFVSILPELEDPPEFLQALRLQTTDSGGLRLAYQLQTVYPDRSDISWYRCRDPRGVDAIRIGVTRQEHPLRRYQPTAADAGYYIMAVIKPRHQMSRMGAPRSVISSRPVAAAAVLPAPRSLVFEPEWMAVDNQPELLPGFFSFDAFAPEDTRSYQWQADNSRPAWYVGAGTDGAADHFGLVQAQQGARMRYTPMGGSYKNMEIRMTAIPAKTAGQGFGSARAQYLDLFIKFDTRHLTGYALRIERTSKYSDAVDFTLMRYDNGKVEPLSSPVSTVCFRPDCEILLSYQEGLLRVHAENKRIKEDPGVGRALSAVVDIEVAVPPNDFGGFGIQHTGTVGAGATLIRDLEVSWE